MAISNRATIPLLVIIGVLLLAVLLLFQNPGEKSSAQDITYTEFLMSEPHLRDVVLRGDQATGHDDTNRAFSVLLPHDPAIATRLAQNHVSVIVRPADDQQSWLITLLVNGLPLIAYIFLLTWPLYRIARSLDALTHRLDRQFAPPQE